MVVTDRLSNNNAGRPTIPRAAGSLPLVGHALQLAFTPLAFLTGIAKTGGVVRVDLGRTPLMFVTDPALVRQIQNDGRVFDMGGPLYDKARDLIGQGLLTSPYDDHKLQRRALQPAFSSRQVPSHTGMMLGAITEVLGGWYDGRRFDVARACFDITTSIATRAMFATDLGAGTIATLGEDLSVYFRWLFLRTVMPAGGQLLDRPFWQYGRAVKRLHATVDSIISARRKAGGDREDLLSTMFAARDEAGLPWAEQQIHDQVITLFLAGIETTAAVMAWTLHLLVQNPDSAARVYRELDTVLGDRLPGKDDLAQLDELRRAILEAMRLYPPGWFFTRIVACDTMLGPYVLRKGDSVAYSPYVLHRTAAAFDDPELFDPDRWLPARAKNIPDGAFVPFGGGVHACIGEQFGRTETMLALATMLSRWKFHPDKATAIRPVPRRATLVPAGLIMQLQSRTNGMQR